MSNKLMGDMISGLRKEKGMTQRELADLLGITDKAVSKWERNIAYPDTATIPKIAKVFDISVEELMSAKVNNGTESKYNSSLISIILKAVPIAMGVAVTVTSLLGVLDTSSGICMLGIGLTCIGIDLLRSK